MMRESPTCSLLPNSLDRSIFPPSLASGMSAGWNGRGRVGPLQQIDDFLIGRLVEVAVVGTNRHEQVRTREAYDFIGFG